MAISRKIAPYEYFGSNKRKKFISFFPRQQDDPPAETVDSCVNQFIEEFAETGDCITVQMKISQTIAEMNKIILHDIGHAVQCVQLGRYVA